MTVNRILRHIGRATKQESRYALAVRWREQAQAVVDRIEAVVGEDPLRWWLMSAASLADDESPFCKQVCGLGNAIEPTVQRLGDRTVGTTLRASFSSGNQPQPHAHVRETVGTPVGTNMGTNA